MISKNGESQDLITARESIEQLVTEISQDESIDSSVDSESIVQNGNEKVSEVLAEVGQLEIEISTDTTLSEVEKAILLRKARAIEDETVAWWKNFSDKIKKTGHNFFRKPGQPWYEDRLLGAHGLQESNDFSVIQKNLVIASERLAYIKKNKLYSFSYPNEKESVAAWNSAWGHIFQGSKNLESALVDNEDERLKSLLSKAADAADNFWSIVLEHRRGGVYSSQIDPIFIKKDKIIPHDFFDNMPDVLRKGFQRALLVKLEKGFEDKDGNITSFTSAYVTSRAKNSDLICAYISYLEASFSYEELIAILNKTKPENTELELLGLDRDKQAYSSLSRRGLEDDVANMAIHHAALEVAGVPTDEWYGDDKKKLDSVLKKTKELPVVFLEKLYENLKDHPTVLIQAFKGLLKIKTTYYAPAGAYKAFAGYAVISKDEGGYVSSYQERYGAFPNFEERNKLMKGFVFDFSSAEDMGVLLNFILKKGVENEHMNTLGGIFLASVKYSIENDKSDFAQSIYDAVESDEVAVIKQFNTFFPDDLNDGGVLLNEYLKHKKNGVDIFTEINVEQVSLLRAKSREAFNNLFKFISEHIGESNCPQLIGVHTKQLATFIETMGFFNEDCFVGYVKQVDQGNDVLKSINRNELSVVINNDVAKRNLINFFIGSLNNDNFPQLIGVHTKQLATFIETMGFFNEDCFVGYVKQVDQGNDVLKSINRNELSVVINDVAAKTYFIKNFITTSGQDAMLENINEFIHNIFLFIKCVGFFHEHAHQVVVSGSHTVSESLDILSELPHDLTGSVKLRILDTFETWIVTPPEKRESYLKILTLIDGSPSQEIKRIANELAVEIIASDNPLQSWQKIESIFIKNNLPLIGKIYKIFNVLHPPDKMGHTLAVNAKLSPYLRTSSQKRRQYTIFNDLLKIHIESGNRSLSQYLKILKDGEVFFKLLESSNTGEDISVEDRKRLQAYIGKLNTIFAETQMGVGAPSVSGEEYKTLDQFKNFYYDLRRTLSVKEGQSISDRVIEMFAARLGYKNIDEVLKAMHDKKHEAHQRGLNYFNDSEKGYLKFQNGDFLKGVDENYIATILQNGSVAKEYLGAGSSQDATPYDTDVAKIHEIGECTFDKILGDSLSSSYGQITFVIRDRGQFVRTGSESAGVIDSSKLEVFNVDGGEHYGIRTGFPTTEIDFIVFKSKNQNPNQIFLEIVQNGYYIPVVDIGGKIIFTPEEYGQMRNFYVGLDRFDGDRFIYEPAKTNQQHIADVKKVTAELIETKERVVTMTKGIQEVLSDVLHEQGIHLKDKYDTGILGAELLDTGSTGRHTNLSDSFDFDLVLKLDVGDETKVAQLVNILKSRLNPKKDSSYGGGGGNYQLRFEGAVVAGQAVDIDIAFVRKSELVQYGSHDAVREKLDWIREHDGDDVVDSVLANIVLAKKVLKNGEAYKKQEQGGMGGIGVENWILAHGGNFELAAQAFWKASHRADGSLHSLDDFRKIYRIIDPGINVKFHQHDNFVFILKEDGYKNMIKTISSYFDWK